LASKVKPPKKELNQEDFLNLLSTQMQYQDPLKPMDNQELTAQMTSFSSLNQLVAIGKKLDSLQQTQTTLSQVQATSLIGKEVSMKGDSLQLAASGSAESSFTLTADAARVSVHILDSEGGVVRTTEAGTLEAGEQKVVWDGKDDKGNRMAPGLYSIEVNAFNAQGKTVDAQTLVKGVVSGVDLSGSTVFVTVNGVPMPLSALTAVQTPLGA
jgi:flagellar basal-body rod modification protein FlgD